MVQKPKVQGGSAPYLLHLSFAPGFEGFSASFSVTVAVVQ
jgi:hypothetical protein